jgi:hypothetical protein
MPLKEEDYVVHGRAKLRGFTLIVLILINILLLSGTIASFLSNPHSLEFIMPLITFILTLAFSIFAASRTKNHQYWLTNNSLIIETNFLKKVENELPLNYIQSIEIKRIGAMYFKKILAIKMHEEFFKTHDRPQVTTAAYDYFISDIPEAEMVSIIKNVELSVKNKSNTVEKKPLQTKSNISPDFEKGIRLQKKLNLYLFLTFALLYAVIFALVIKGTSGLINYAASFFCFIVSSIFVSSAIIGLKYGVDYGLGVFRVSDISGGRFVAHKETAQIINIVKLVGGLMFISLGITFLILALFH